MLTIRHGSMLCEFVPKQHLDYIATAGDSLPGHLGEHYPFLRNCLRDESYASGHSLRSTVIARRSELCPGCGRTH